MEVISVVIPTKNRKEELKRAIKSVLTQDFEDYEIIVVDDGNGEGEEVIKEFKDERIRYFKTEGNKGASHSRNIGIEKSKGSIISFLDDDDEFLPERLKTTMEVFSSLSEEWGLVFSSYLREKNGKITLYPSKKYRGKNLKGNLHNLILEKNFITPSAVSVRKKYLEEIGGFDENFPRLNDWELWIRLSRICKFYFIEKVLAIQHVSKISISTNEEYNIIAQKLIFQKHWDDFLNNCRSSIFGYRLYLLGKLLIKNGKREEGIEYIEKARRVYPFNLRFWFTELKEKLKKCS